MRFTIYIAIEGGAFSPETFNHNLPPDLRGAVMERRHARPRPGGAERIYWRSQIVAREQHPEEGLIELINMYKTEFAKISPDNAIKISAVIVGLKADCDDFCGFYLSKDLVRGLADANADLDIDIVRDLER